MLPSAGGGRLRSLADTPATSTCRSIRSNSGPEMRGLVIGAAFGGAAAGLCRIAQITAAAGIHGRHKLEPRRIAHMRIGPRHHRLAGFNRLAQTVQRPALEFRQLVQKQNAQMRQRHFTGPHFQPAAHPAPPSRRNDADCGTAGPARSRRRPGSPARLRTMEISSASRASSGGKMPGSLCASIDLPRAGRPDHQKVMGRPRRRFPTRAWRFPGPSHLSNRARRGTPPPAWAMAGSAPSFPSCD